MVEVVFGRSCDGRLGREGDWEYEQTGELSAVVVVVAAG